MATRVRFLVAFLICQGQQEFRVLANSIPAKLCGRSYKNGFLGAASNYRLKAQSYCKSYCIVIGLMNRLQFEILTNPDK
jgi:hypothetical protein